MVVTRTLGWHKGAEAICTSGFTLERLEYVSSTLGKEVAGGGVGAIFERSRIRLSAEHNLGSRRQMEHHYYDPSKCRVAVTTFKCNIRSTVRVSLRCDQVGNFI